MKFLDNIFGFFSKKPEEKKLSRKHFEIKYPEKFDEIVLMAMLYGWKVIDWQETIGLLSFKKDDVRINVYTTKMTVGTCLTHPKKGKTQLFRKNVDEELLEKIFENPRIHSGRGYRKK